MNTKYDIIGVNYAELRKPDPRIARVILQALGSARCVLNVGAGTGSYEPDDRDVVAVEPSAEMIRKRRANSAPVVKASAEDLPFEDGQFDAAMAILTIHHWQDKKAGLREMMRVTRGPVVLLTHDPLHRPWLTDYFPELATLDEKQMPALSDYERWLGAVQISPVPIPYDCTDGFLYAYWKRPRAYLDRFLRSGISSFWMITDLASGLDRLSHDLESGEWARRYSDLITKTEYDAGYRLIVADSAGIAARA